MKKVSVAICTYNRYDLLEKAIESLTYQTMPVKAFDIFIIDNSPDFEKSKEQGVKYEDIPNLHYIIERRPGLSNARNVATDLCDSEFIAFLDDDAIASEEWLEKIIEVADKYGEKVDAIGGRIDPIWELPRPTWLGDSHLGYVSVVNWGGECRIAGENEWFAGANVTFRVEVLKKFGGFDTSLGRKGSGASLMSNEESELVDKIRASGALLIYQPEARVDHLVEAKRLERKYFRRRAAWQAVSDFVMNPDEQERHSEHDWHSLKAFINSMPPQERSIRALHMSTDDPDVFKWQLSAVYAMTRLTLSGFDGLEDL